MDKNKKNARHRKHKKGVLFSVSVGLFLVTLLLFSVAVFRFTGENEEKLEDFSLTTKVITLSSSIEQAVQTIYETKKNTSFFYDTYYNSQYFDRLTINATFDGDDGKLGGLITTELHSLGLFVNNSFDGIFLNTSALAEPIELSSANGITFYKNESIFSIQSIVIFYNKSGGNNHSLTHFNFSFYSNDITDLNWTTSELPVGDYLFDIHVFDTDDLDPETPTSITSSFSIIGSTYAIAINDSGGTPYINVSIDAEKIVIQSLVGIQNSSLQIITPATTDSDTVLTTVNPALHITYDDFSFESHRKIRFS